MGLLVQLRRSVVFTVLLCAAPAGLVPGAALADDPVVPTAPAADDAVGDPVAPPAAQPAETTAPTAPVAGTTPAVPARFVSAWLVPWDAAKGEANLVANAASYRELSPFWLVLDAQGRIVRRADLSPASVPRLQAQAAATGVPLLPTIANGFVQSRVHRVLRTPASRAAHARALAQLVAAQGWAGLDVDYENVATADRSRFTAFVQTLAAELHARGLRLSVTLQAQTGAGTSGGEDQAAIGAVADVVRVMAYDQHWSGGKAGPVAGLQWVRAVVAHLTLRVDPAKVQLGLPLYGYDWRVGHTGASSVTMSQGLALAAAKHATVRYSAVDGAATFTYRRGTVRHVVWFETPRSVAVKVAVAKAAGLQGVAFWRLGGERFDTFAAAATAWAGATSAPVGPVSPTPSTPAAGATSPTAPTDPAVAPVTTPALDTVTPDPGSVVTTP